MDNPLRIGIFWKRMTATAGWVGLVSGTLGAVAVWLLNEERAEAQH